MGNGQNPVFGWEELTSVNIPVEAFDDGHFIGSGSQRIFNKKISMRIF